MSYTPRFLRSLSRRTWLLVPLSAILMVAAHGQSSLTAVDKFSIENSGYLGAEFGAQVAISGNTAVIGAARRDFYASVRDGHAYVYTRTGPSAPWVYTERLFPTGVASGECFGHSVAISGDVVVVGSGSPASTDPGAAYVFRRTGGSFAQVARLTEPSSLPGGGDYGRAVDVSGATVVVSDPLQLNEGRVYVYSEAGGNWSLQQTLAPPAGSPGAFGVAVALDADRVAVGVERNGLGVGGEVRVFRRASGVWSHEATLQPNTAPYGQFQNDHFGAALDLFDTTLVVGAPEDSDPAVPSTVRRGAAFVFTRSGVTWSQSARIDPTLVEPQSRFGSGVAVGGNSVVAIGADGIGAGFPPHVTRGRVLLFERVGGVWRQKYELTSVHSDDEDHLGNALAIAPSAGGWSLLCGVPRWFGGRGSVYAFQTGANDWSEGERLIEPVHSSARFGNAVAIEGELAVVGAPYEDTEWGQDAGAAYVYRRTGAIWAFVQRLAPSVSAEFDRFGSAVAVSGTTIAVAAPNDDHPAAVDAGSVFVFDLVGTTWTLTQVLRASDAAARDFFGTSIAMRGGTLVIGSPLDDNASGNNAGGAYVFTRSGTTWTQATKLASNDLAPSDQFGQAVAIVTSSRVLVGAPFDNAAGVDSGSAYVFDRTGLIGGGVWSQRAKLVPSGGSQGDHFGMAVSGTTALIAVGAPERDGAQGVDHGSAYIFQVSGGVPGTLGNVFTERQTLSSPTPNADDGFGTSVVIEGVDVLVGSPLDDHLGATDAGALFHFRPQASGLWAVTGISSTGDERPSARHGIAVALSGNWAIGGAFLDTNNSGGSAGAAYVFDTWRGAGVGTAYCAAATNSTGQAATITGLGSPFRLSNDLVLQAARLPLNASVFFIVSRTPGLTAHPGGSNGDLCLSGAIGRFVGPGQVLNAGATGVAQLAIDLGSIPQPNGLISGRPGETWHFQAWYRDSVTGVPTSNFSNGLAVVLH